MKEFASHPYQRLIDAMMVLAERYAAEERWDDALRLVGAGLALVREPAAVEPCQLW